MKGDLQTYFETQNRPINKQRLVQDEQPLSQQVNILKDLMSQQLAVNKAREQQKIQFEHDISLLKTICLEQNQKISQLQKEIAGIGNNSRSLFQTKDKNLRLQNPKRPTPSFKPCLQSSSMDNQDSFISIIDLQHKQKNFSFQNSINIHQQNNYQKSQAQNTQKIKQYYAKLNYLLENGAISNGLRDTLVKIGEQLRNQNKAGESLKYYLQANEVCLKLIRQQVSIQAEIVFWIACNMSDLGYYDDAIRYYKQEVSIRQSLNETSSEDIAASLNNIGHNYYLKHQHQVAINFFERATQMQTLIKGRNDSYVALYLKNIAQVYFSQSNFKQAEKYCLQSLEIYKNIGQKHTQYCAWCHYFLSVIYFRTARVHLCAKNVLLSVKAFVLTSKREQFKKMLGIISKNGQKEVEMKVITREVMDLLYEKDEKTSFGVLRDKDRIIQRTGLMRQEGEGGRGERRAKLMWLGQ